MLIPNPAATLTNAITIDTPAARIWPWLVQMGSGRAGWYSYDRVDNDGHRSATEIIPSLQAVVPGMLFPSLPGATSSFILARVEPEHDLILTVPDSGGGLLVSWEFLLEPSSPSSTRLVVRGRVSSQWPAGGSEPPPPSPRPIERLYALLASFPRWLMGPAAMLGHGVMQARQLRGIKQRAEAGALPARALDGQGR